MIDVSHVHNFLPRVTISPKGVAFLASHGHFLRTPESTIRDKSKADIMEKVLVCVQVAGMLVQTVRRRAVGYPITLLEVHTLVRVACAITMYGFWFQKPLGVPDPAWVDASAFQDLLALMLAWIYGYGTRWHLDGETASTPASVQSIDHSYQTGSESSYLQAHLSRVKDGPKENTTSKEAETILARKVSQSRTLQRSRISPPEIVTHEAGDSFGFAFDAPENTQTSCTVLSGKSLPCGIGPALNCIYRLVILFGVLNIPLFLLSRVYIIVETFISLGRVPLGVYATVGWADYILHL